MNVTHGDEVRADGPYRNSILRITIACTGVAVVGFSLCLHVNRRHPVMPTVIRLSRGHLLPPSRPAGHNQCSTKTALPPTPDETEVPTALRGINQRLNSNAQLMPTCRLHCVAPTNACPCTLDLLLLAETCLNARSLLRFHHGDCHPQGRSPRERTVSRWCIADNHCMHRSGGRTLFSLLARQTPPPR
ncbi:hypothetical protein LF1_56020 [Rubripirellula obstinata]|uniref:Uncharacterized protein n=1 Tax=Rubripirellula obstinata TaxID=406547 RepID=A0A5B1CAA1_9BACT|nr:hypothetical protein LF1_56020 [Rubripirellula obstinata]